MQWISESKISIKSNISQFAAGPELEYYLQISQEQLYRIFLWKNSFSNIAYAKFSGEILNFHNIHMLLKNLHECNKKKR